MCSTCSKLHPNEEPRPVGGPLALDAGVGAPGEAEHGTHTRRCPQEAVVGDAGPMREIQAHVVAEVGRCQPAMGVRLLEHRARALEERPDERTPEATDWVRRPENPLCEMITIDQNRGKSQ